MKKLKFLIAAIGMSLFVGCGGGSGSIDDGIDNTVDNSLLADGVTDLGYYGEFVVFGNHALVRRWTLTNPNQPNSPIYITFTETDFAIKEEGNTVSGIDFGVSKDGRSVLIDDGSHELVEIYLSRASSPDCYDANLIYVNTSESINISICAQDIP